MCCKHIFTNSYISLVFRILVRKSYMSTINVTILYRFAQTRLVSNLVTSLMVTQIMLHFWNRVYVNVYTDKALTVFLMCAVWAVKMYNIFQSYVAKILQIVELYPYFPYYIAIWYPCAYCLKVSVHYSCERKILYNFAQTAILSLVS